MKTIKNILGLLLALIVAATFNSCDDELYKPAEKLDSKQVYFPSYNPNVLEIDAASADNFVKIDIARVDTKGQLTVPLTVEWADEEADTDLLSIPSSITFEDGEEIITFKVTYDINDFNFDEFYDITIAIANAEELTPYGIHAYEVKIGLPAPWTSLGEGIFMEDLMTTFFGVEPHPYKLEIHEHDLVPGLYRLVNPFGKAYKYNDEGDWDDSKDWYLEINAEDPECVYIEVQPTGMNWGYGMVHVGSIGGLRKEQGWTNAKLKDNGLAGTLEDGIITFPEGQMLIGMEDYNDFGKYPANGDGMTKIALPGSVLADYALEIAYAGKYTDSEDYDIGAMCLITEVGEDVETIQIALIPKKDIEDIEDVAEDIDNETIESVLVKQTDGYFPETPIMVPFAEEPEDGDYVLVAVAYNSEKESQTIATSLFTYASTTIREKWEAKNIGTYEYKFFYEGEDDEAVLYQSEDDPSRWKISDWGEGVDFIFTYDEESGEVEVLEQEIGYVHPNHGTVYVMELPGYAGPDYPSSYFEDDVFYFSVIYFVDAGAFQDSHGFETYTITESITAKEEVQPYTSVRSFVPTKLPTVKSMVSQKELKQINLSAKLVR